VAVCWLRIPRLLPLVPYTTLFRSMIVERERPDGLLPTLGGQTGLNLALGLSREGVLERAGVRLLGTPLDAIEKAEDRERFKETRSEEHTSELQSRENLVCRLLLEK